MWSDKLLSAILERRYSNAWPEKFKAGFEALFGVDGGRYPESAKRRVTLRGSRAFGRRRRNHTIRSAHSPEQPQYRTVRWYLACRFSRRRHSLHDLTRGRD